MNLRTLCATLALCSVLVAGVPATAAPTSAAVLEAYVTTLFDNCVKAVQTRTEVDPASLKAAFVPDRTRGPKEFKAAKGGRFSLAIGAGKYEPCMFTAQNGAVDNRAIAKLLRQKLDAAHAMNDEPSRIKGGESWLVPAAEGRKIRARVTLESVWSDEFLVIHFLDAMAPSPQPVPPVAPPSAPPPPR
jgi:hypothetical protein